MSCDNRITSVTPVLPTGPADDLTPPVITFALSAGTNNVVDIGTALTVTVTATDNVGVQVLNTTFNNGATLLGADTSTNVPVRTPAVRTLKVPLAGLAKGTKVTIRSAAGDASQNKKIDSIIVTLNDTLAPKVTLTSQLLSRKANTVKGGDTLDVSIVGSDSAGIAYVGYRLLYPRATDTVVVRAESTLVAAGTNPTVFAPSAYSYVLPDTMLTGGYVLTGFAKDASGLITNPGATRNFTVIDGQKPTLTFIAPLPTAKLNVGDSLLVTARLQDNIGVSRVSFRGVSARGSVALGTADTVLRYSTVGAPQTGTFRPGLRDTTIQRYLKVVQPVDSTTDSLIVYGVLVDGASLVDTELVIIRMVTGPKVVFLAPVLGDSATAAAGLTVTLRATHNVGVAKLGFRMQGAAGWPTPLDTTVVVTFGTPGKDVTMSATIQIPANAPAKSIITITPISQDVDGQEGSSAPFLIAVRNGAAPPPRVYQTVAPRLEITDSIFVTALGQGITSVGYELRDNTGAVIKTYSAAQASPYPSTAVVGLPLNLPPSVQGKTIAVISFAADQGGRTGYSLRSNVTIPQTDKTQAFVDSTLIVYGRTFALPTNRSGSTIADVVVDQARGNVFLSNINQGRLEVWQKSTGSFDPNGIVVGSQPWGMTIARTNSETLFVANSGGTNLSRVFIGTTNASLMKEDLANRMLTRISAMYKVSEQRDPATGRIRLSIAGPMIFSDRPQYVQQSAQGVLYLSTKPTTAAPRGTVRYMDPSAAAPDQRFILAFANRGGDANSFLIANIDQADVIPAPAASTASDLLVLCDHNSGTTAAPTCASSRGGVLDAIDSLRFYVPQTDVEVGPNLDENSLGLTDTTYVASSGDGQWIAFGEGNASPTARAFLLRDDGTVPKKYSYASPSLNILDLINNASDKVYGIALDKTGKTLGIHGVETYFAAVTQPFTQRLQGKKSTFNVGAGITFHPNADGTTTPQDQRLAFVASNNGSVELVDIAYYDFNRGTLATKFNLYGPLRASLPFPGDDPSVVLKLFGVSPNGLVVIDVTAADILPGP